MTTFQQIKADIRTHIAAIEADGSDEQVGKAAQFFSRFLFFDRRLTADYKEQAGLDQAPRILAAIEALPEDHSGTNGSYYYGPPDCPVTLLADALRRQRRESDRYLEEMRRPRTPADILKETVAEAERSASALELDEVAFLIGLFDLNIDYLFENLELPKLKAKLREMKPARSHHEARLTCSRQRNDDNIVGRVADLLIRYMERS